MKKPHCDFEKLREEIVARLPKLSHRLQQIARFALEHPNDMALQNIAMLARCIGVPPSAIIRFAKALDYRGFSDMQAVFRLPLSDSLFSYRNGPVRLPRKTPCESGHSTAVDVLEELRDTGLSAVKQLLREVSPARLEQAVHLLVESRAIYVIGQRQAFPVAAYLGYALTHLARDVHVLDGVGGMLPEQASSISDRDVLVAVSLPPYAQEMAELAARAAAKGAAVIAITDSPLNPIAGAATVYLEVHERRIHSLPSFTTTLYLVQALVICVSLQLQAKAQNQKPCRVGTA